MESQETVPNPRVSLPCPTCFHLSGAMQEQNSLRVQIPAAMKVLQAVGRRGLGEPPPNCGSLSLVPIKLFHPSGLV